LLSPAGNLAVDWTKPHRSNIEASVQSAVRRVLYRNKIKGEQLQFLRKRLMEQAKALYEQWPEVG
jgi:type I restriction enzyme R subunit